jgi:hypothetical protein
MGKRIATKRLISGNQLITEHGFHDMETESREHLETKPLLWN